MRLNLAQAFQAIGTVVAPVLAAYVIFKDVGAPGGTSLESVQWVYLGIACFVCKYHQVHKRGRAIG